MPKFSQSSIDKLTNLDTSLRSVLEEAIKHVDFTVLCTYRDELEQAKAFVSGKSKVKWPNSKHNKIPSDAVDIAPFPIDWNNLNRFEHLAGFIKGIAAARGIKIRWGGDWNGDFNSKNDKFADFPHFEIVR